MNLGSKQILTRPTNPCSLLRRGRNTPDYFDHYLKGKNVESPGVAHLEELDVSVW